MKLIAHIPVEKVPVACIGYTFTTKQVEVEVVRITRTSARRDKSVWPHRVIAWYYGADIADHPELAPEAIRTSHDKLYHVNINRALNPKWKPPVFPEGKNWVDVERACKSN